MAKRKFISRRIKNAMQTRWQNRECLIYYRLRQPWFGSQYWQKEIYLLNLNPRWGAQLVAREKISAKQFFADQLKNGPLRDVDMDLWACVKPYRLT